MNTIKMMMRLYEKFCYGVVRHECGPVLFLLAICALAYVGNLWVSLFVAIFFALMLICFWFIKVPKKHEEERWGVFPKRGTMIPGFNSQCEADQYIADHKMEEGMIARQLSANSARDSGNSESEAHETDILSRLAKETSHDPFICG